MKVLNLFLLISFIYLTPYNIQCQTKEIKLVSASQLKARVADTDTFFVVNFWATWCKPCVEELPELEKFSVQNTKKPVKVILVSLDFTEELEKRVLSFVNEKKLTCEVLLLKDTNPNLFVPVIYPKWSGSIPATWIIQKKQVMFLERKTTAEELEEIKSKMKD